MWFLTWVSNYWIKCVKLTAINDRKGKGLNTGQACRSELPMMNTVNMTFKKKITNLKSLSLRWVRWSWMTLKLILKNHKVPCVIFLKKFVLKIFWKLRRALERNCGTESKTISKTWKIIMETFVYHTASCCVVLGSSEVLSNSLLVRKNSLLPVCRKPIRS